MSDGQTQSRTHNLLAKDGGVAIDSHKEGTDALDLRIHSDCRQVNWTFVVAPMLSPLECYSETLKKCNRNVLQIAALHLITTEEDNPSKQG